MYVHANARTTVQTRRAMVELVARRVPKAEVARRFGTSDRTVRKWWRRWQLEGDAGLWDRSTRPHRSPNRTPAMLEAAIVGLRRDLAIHGVQIAHWTGLAVSTVYDVLRRCRELWRPTRPPQNRWEVDTPGELVHIDIKKLRRIGDQPGWRVLGRREGMYKAKSVGTDYIHVAIDACTRLAYAEALPDERKESCDAFLQRAVEWYALHGIRVQRVLTDNGPGYKSTVWRQRCELHGIRHSRTRPYTPRTNGKAERLIQTLLREWAYVRPYQNNPERLSALPRWQDYYNHHRVHSAIRSTPVERAETLQAQETGNKVPVILI